MRVELHADGGIVAHDYDAFGNEVGRIDANGNLTRYVYDRLNRRVSTSYAAADVYKTEPIESPSKSWFTESDSVLFNVQAVGQRQIVETAQYDEAGRRIAQTNGERKTVQMRYDLRGNLVETIDALGYHTRMAYDSHNRQIALTDANGNTATWAYDDFGLLRAHTDIGGAAYTYHYDDARQLLQQTNSRGQDVRYTYALSGDLIEILDAATDKRSSYRYDADGRRISERAMQAGELYQNNRLVYDALGQLAQVTDTSAGRARISIAYDAAGNRQRIVTDISADGTGTVPYHSEGWYAYDAMNRQIVVNAKDAAGNLGTQGHRLAYDLNGNRISDTWYGTRLTPPINTGVDKGTIFGGLANDLAGSLRHAPGYTTATYTYDAMNRLVATRRDGELVETRVYDAASRVLRRTGAALSSGLIDALNAGVNEQDQLSANTTEILYDDNGRVLVRRERKPGGDTDTQTDYSDGYDALGNVLRYRVIKYGDDSYTNTYTNRYARYASYVITDTAGSSTLFDSGTSHRKYDVNGNLIVFADDTKEANNRFYINDALGQALSVRQGSHLQHQIIVTGQVLGRYGSAVNPADSRNDDGDPQFADIHDLNFTYQTVNPTHPGDAPGSYSLLAGDTLQGIARQVYGDSAYWYLLADANGTNSTGALRPGQALRIPNITGTTHNHANSFKPYDPSVVIGDTTPNLPPPDDSSDLAQIFVVMVAVFVAVVAPGLIGPMVQGIGLGELGTAVVTYGLSYAAASVVSQGVAIALGIQKGFDWKQVGLAAIGGMVSAAIPLPSGGVINSVVKAALANAVTQGIGVVTGLQDHFSWASVAAAGIGAGVGEVVGEALKSVNAFSELGTFGMKVAQGTVRGFTAGLTTAALRGGRMSVVQVAADAFGSALGYGLADTMLQTPAPAAQYNIAYGMRSTMGFRADASVLGAGLGDGAREYQPEDLSSPGNAQADTSMQTDHGADHAYNPAADPEVQAGAQRFLAMNPTASNDVADPSQPLTASTDRLHLSLSRGDNNTIDDSLVPSAAMRFAQSYTEAHPDATYGEVQQAYDEAWAAQSDAHLLRGAKEAYSASVPQIEAGGIRPIGPVEGFLTFNPVGRTIMGTGEGISNMASGFVETGKQAGLMVGDALGYGLSQFDNVLGGDMAYKPQSALASSIQSGGLGITTLNVIGGLVHGTVGVGLQPLNALYRQDAQMFGASLPGFALTVASPVQAGNLNKLSAKGLGNQNPLYQAAVQQFKNSDLSNAGRALTKHPEVVGETKESLRQLLRADGEINDAAHTALKDIMRNGVATNPTLGRYGPVIQIQIPGGFGARWAADGSFIGSINP